MRPIDLLHSVGALGGALPAANCFVATVAAVDIPGTSLTDRIEPNGDCSPREAIEAANTDSAVDGCPAGAGPAGIPAGTIMLSIPPLLTDTNAAGDMDLLSELTLQGVDARATVIDGTGIDRILHISTTAVVTVAVEMLTRGHVPYGVDSDTEEFRPGKGEDGSGILNEGSLALHRVTVSDNQAGSGGGIAVFLPLPSMEPGAAGRGGGISLPMSPVRRARSPASARCAAPTAATGAGSITRVACSPPIAQLPTTGRRMAAASSPCIFRECRGTAAAGRAASTMASDWTMLLMENIAGRSGIARTEIYTRTRSDGVGGGVLAYATGDVTARNSILAGNRAALTANECTGRLYSLGFNLVYVVDGCTITGTVDRNVYPTNPS